MIIDKIVLQDGGFIINVDTVEERDRLILLGVDVDYIEKENIEKETYAFFERVIEEHLDTKAQSFGYENIMSARSYAGYENKFKAEATTLAIWASSCWVKAEEIETAVKNGEREIPTVDELFEEMPVYTGS